MSDRLYYSDSFLKQFPARITDIREVSRREGQSLWQVALDRTVFYPTSGGQPFDTGTLRATSRNGAVLEAPIDAVEEDEGGEVWHFTAKPLAAGTPVEGEIDWDRRLDHMQQHSGQHLLSAVFAKELHAATVSFHLGEMVSTIDLTGAPLSLHSIERVERIANGLIAEDRPVSVRTVDRAAAEAMLAAGALRKLPEREGPIRLIEIEDYDLNACGGTHVRATGQIGGLQIRGVEKVSRGMRVEFVCGLRAAAASRRDATVLAKAASLLSAAGEEIPAGIERLQSEAKSGAKERQRLREEIAALHAAQIGAEIAAGNLATGEPRFIEKVFFDRDREYIRLLGSKLAASMPRVVSLLFAAEADPVSVVLARSRDLDLPCGQTMREALAAMGLRGGGSPDLAQGEVAKAQMEMLRNALRERIGNAVPAPVAKHG